MGRRQLVSAPYSMQARRAATATSAESSSDLACSGCVAESELDSALSTVLVKTTGDVTLTSGAGLTVPSNRTFWIDGGITATGATLTITGVVDVDGHLHGQTGTDTVTGIMTLRDGSTLTNTSNTFTGIASCTKESGHTTVGTDPCP